MFAMLPKLQLQEQPVIEIECSQKDCGRGGGRGPEDKPLVGAQGAKPPPGGSGGGASLHRKKIND